MRQPFQDPLIEEALHWLVVLEDRHAGPADREAFVRWLDIDPSHGAAWQRAQQVWMRLERVGVAFGDQPRPPRASGPPRLVAARPHRGSTQAHAGRRRLLLAMGAGAVAVLGVPAILLATRARPVGGSHATAGSERRAVGPGDGSEVELRAGERQ